MLLQVLKYPVLCFFESGKCFLRRDITEMHTWGRREVPRGLELFDGLRVVDSLGFSYRLRRPKRRASLSSRVMDFAISRLTVEFESIESEGDAGLANLQTRLVEAIQTTTSPVGQNS